MASAQANLDGTRTEYFDVECSEAALLALLREMFEAHWRDVIFGPCIEGAVFEGRFGEKPTISLLDGYATVQVGGSESWHFHLCIGPHRGSSSLPTPPELAEWRRCARAAFFRNLDRGGRASSWGVRMWNGRGEQMLTVFFPNPWIDPARAALRRRAGLVAARSVDDAAGAVRRPARRAAPGPRRAAGDPLTRRAASRRLHAARAPDPPRAQDPERRPAPARRHAVPRRGHGVVPAPRPARAHGALPRGRHLRGRGAPRAGLPAAPPRFRIGPGRHRPRHRRLQRSAAAGAPSPSRTTRGCATASRCTGASGSWR